MEASAQDSLLSEAVQAILPYLYYEVLNAKAELLRVSLLAMETEAE